MNDFVAQLSVSVVTDVPTLYMEDEYFQAKLAKYWNATPKRPLDRPGAGTRQCPGYTRLVSGRGIGESDVPRYWGSVVPVFRLSAAARISQKPHRPKLHQGPSVLYAHS